MFERVGIVRQNKQDAEIMDSLKHDAEENKIKGK